MKKKIGIGLVLFVMTLNIACTGWFSEKVPPGYKGVIMNSSGIENKILSPGYYTCWGRDRMVLIDESDSVNNEKMSILCKDELNFSLDLELRGCIKFDDPTSLMAILKKQGSKIRWINGSVGVLDYQTLYTTYIQATARSITRSVVTKYAVVEIRGARSEIEETIKTRILEEVANYPISIGMVKTNNFDYPAIITLAVEKKRSRELEIQAEKARLEMELNRMDNKLKLESKRKALLSAQAQNDAIRMNILKGIISPEYLRLCDLENEKMLIENIEKVGTVILNTGGGSLPSLALPTNK